MIHTSVKGINVHAPILSHLDELNTAHLAKKAFYFAKGLPFYTSIDEVKNLHNYHLKAL